MPDNKRKPRETLKPAGKQRAGREALAAVGLLGAVLAGGAMSRQWNLNEQKPRPLIPPKSRGGRGR